MRGSPCRDCPQPICSTTSAGRRTGKPRWDAFRARPDVQARLQTGLQRMERLWSIETGIIEGLYTLNQGTTTTLLEYGFVPNVIRAQDTNIEPERLLLILNDHHTSVGLVHGYIRDERPLSAHTIRELHACITSHQDTHDAVDSLGHRVQRHLRRGVFKHYPNNPTRLDGWVHQYCPPEQVDSELARLLHLYEIYKQADDIMSSCTLCRLAASPLCPDSSVC